MSVLFLIYILSFVIMIAFTIFAVRGMSDLMFILMILASVVPFLNTAMVLTFLVTFLMDTKEKS